MSMALTLTQISEQDNQALQTISSVVPQQELTLTEERKMIAEPISCYPKLLNKKRPRLLDDAIAYFNYLNPGVSKSERNESIEDIILSYFYGGLQVAVFHSQDGRCVVKSDFTDGSDMDAFLESLPIHESHHIEVIWPVPFENLFQIKDILHFSRSQLNPSR